MVRAKTIRFRGQAGGHASAVSLLQNAGDVAIDVRGDVRSIVMQCPDGCGDVITVNLDRRAGKAWRLDDRSGALTLYPSVWRGQGCRAHFILWRNSIIWCDWNEGPAWRDDGLVSRVKDELQKRADAFTHYEILAEALEENPWETLWACQVLQNRGHAEVRDRSSFRRAGGQTAPSFRGRFA